jgi:hypothetical protein
MATKSIGIKLEISSQGAEKVITNLQELNNELAIQQQLLSKADFGTKQFTEAASNIQKLRSFTADVDKSLEGLDKEKKIRALGASITALTGSFQVLSGILGLVITDTESLEEVQKAEAAALQVLNVALGINAVNQALVEASQLKLNLATKAYTIATNLAARATALFNAALNANPITLVIGLIVGLTATIYGLVKAYDALFGAEAQEEKFLKSINNLENELIKTKKESSKELEFQLTILTDTITTRNLEIKTLEDLKKAYPGLNAFIDSNNKLTQEGISFIKLEIKLRKEQAALAQIQNKLTEKQIEFDVRSAEIRQEYGASADILIKELKANYDKNVAPIIEVQNRYTKSLDDTLGALKPYQQSLEKQTGTEKVLVEAQRESVKTLSSRTKLLQGLTKLISQQDDELKKLLETEIEYSADVLEIQKEILQDQNELLGKRSELLTDSGEKLRQEAEDLFLAIIPTDEVLSKAEDRFQELFDRVGELIKSGAIPFDIDLSDEALVNALQGVDTELKGLFQNLTDESQLVLLDYFNEYKFRVNELTKIREKLGLQETNSLEVVRIISDLEDKLYDDIRNRANTGKSLLQIEQEIKQEIKIRLGLLDEENKLKKSIETETQNQKELEEQIVASKNKSNKLQADIANTTNEATKKELEKRLKIQEISTKNLELRLETSKEEKEAAEQALEALLSFVETQEDALKRSVGFYEGVVDITEQTSKGFREIKKNAQELKKEFSSQELEKITQFFTDNIENVDDVVFAIFNNLQKYRDRLGSGLNQVVKGLGNEIKKLGVDSKEGLQNSQKYLETYIAIGEALGYDVSEARNLLDVVNSQLTNLQFDKAFDDLDNFTQKVVQQFNQIANSFRTLLQANSSLLLEQLATDEAAALAAVGDASKRARDEQEVIQKEFAKQRFTIEKEARVNEIKFSIAQIISDTAAAVANTLASVPTPFNFPLATIVGGLGLAQAQQARNQLTFVQSQQFVGRRGGLITGQSHEGSNGGVPALLEGGEFVVNKAAVAQYGDLIGELNSSTGGRRLTIDDSRIVQTIASQNSNTPPLKAYVLYNDIQSTDKLNSRITKLARL